MEPGSTVALGEARAIVDKNDLCAQPVLLGVAKDFVRTVAIAASAITLTKPTDPAGRPRAPIPAITLPMAPGTAMIVPKPAAVATARCMLTPLIVMISTAGVPPPMPRSAWGEPRRRPGRCAM